MVKFIIILLFSIPVTFGWSQDKDETTNITEERKEDEKKEIREVKLIYGTASYYANLFEGRQTANGEIFRQNKMTAACNVLPLGTWIRVTNLRNGRSVIVKTNDRLHPRMKRVVDLSRTAATQLNFIKSGLTRVKVEVLGKKKPEN
jgi:rare lipoprotein A